MPRSAQRNRTDLLTPAPVTTAPGQPYGEAAQQQVAQRAIPMAGGATSLPGPAATPQAGNAGQAGPGMDQILQMMQAHAASRGAGRNGPISRLTERPNEPVTAGMPMGPGPGPEALQGIGAATRGSAMEQGTLGNLLSAMAQAPGATSAVRDLAARAVGGAM